MKHWRRGSAAFPAWQLCFNACFLSYLFRVGTMTILRQIRTFGFVKLQTRFIQSSASVFHSFQTPPSVEVTFGDKQARCNDESGIFVSKRTSDILRSLFVLKLCSYDFVARNPVKLMSMGQTVFGKTLFEFLLSKTMYRQFVAGENLPAIQDTIKTLHQCGIGTMLCIPNEEDLSSDYNFSSREEMFDRNTKAILDCIGKTEEGGFSQMKLTAICSPFLLNVLNEHLRPYETTVELPKELSVQTLAEGFHVKIEIPVLSESQNTHLQNVLKRLDTFAKACINRNVQLVIDAEQTYLQAAINHLVLAAQYKYNKDYPWVYNTYQCYRKDTRDRVKANLELMNKLGFHFGAKIVRGAYMAQERNRAADMGYDDPIHDTYEDTCAMYDDVVYTVLQKVRSTPAEVMVASHNEESVQFVIQRTTRLQCLQISSLWPSGRGPGLSWETSNGEQRRHQKN